MRLVRVARGAFQTRLGELAALEIDRHGLAQEGSLRIEDGILGRACQRSEQDRTGDDRGVGTEGDEDEAEHGLALGGC